MSATKPNEGAAFVGAATPSRDWESGEIPSLRATAAALKLLREDGYDIGFRNKGFCDCRVVLGDEHWIGRGRDEPQALADVLRQMFPSRVAWDLFHARGVTPAEKMDEVAHAASPAAPTSEVPIPAAQVVAPRAKSEAVVAKSSVAAALEAVAAIRREMSEGRGSLGRLAPERQRLRIQAFICRARAEQEKHPASAELVRAVAELARELSVLCKLFWPGSVRALQSGTPPSAITARASTWAEAAAHAVALDRVDPTAKLDADGWADGEKLEPPPPRPERLLREVVAVLEKLTGPLGAPHPRMPPPGAAAIAEVLLAASKLRWIRRVTGDAERWALAMGRSRWLAHESRNAELQTRLDSAFVPQSSWIAIASGNAR